MSRDQVDIVQIGGAHTYCRIWDGSGDAFSDLDSASLDYDNASSGAVLWGDDTDYLHMGFTTANNCMMGFKMHTAGVGYGTFSFRHGISNGPYTIQSIIGITRTIYISENVPTAFIDNTVFTIAGTASNDGVYRCNTDAIWTGAATAITVYGPVMTDQGAPGGTVGTVFKPFTPLYLGQANFSKDGYIVWSIPGTWASTTVDSQAAFWIQISQDDSTPTTPAQFYHLMPNATVDPPVTLRYERIEKDNRTFYDTTGDVQNGDIQNDDPRMAEMDCRVNCLSWPDSILLNYFCDYRKRVWVNDLARSGSPVFTTDSYIREFIGKIDHYPAAVFSVFKMDAGEFVISFKVESVVTVFSLTGLTK